MQTPARYYFTLSTDIGTGSLRATLQFFTEEGVAIGDPNILEGTSFCLTWQDLARSIEQRYTEKGGVLNDSLNRPSPFVDLT